MAAPLKDMVDGAVVTDIADRVAAVVPGFDVPAFKGALDEVLPALELKPRIEAVARHLRSALDGDYREALGVIVAVAQQVPPIEGFAAWPLCTFVEVFGVDDPDASLPAMEHLTKRASCEFAIRPFLRDHWEAAYATLEGFTGHPDEQVRRLASEGSRPRLPWASRVTGLIEDPLPGLALLEQLRHDPSEQVRRSVANHLNDVAKDHPEVVIETVRRWVDEAATDSRMISHALRTLVKRGVPEALEVLGFTAEPAVEVVTFTVTPKRVVMGDHIELIATLRSASTKHQRLVVDFIIHHVNASGATSPKVFKWQTVELTPGAWATLNKRRLIQMASTRTYRSGPHVVELQVAGKVLSQDSFDVVV